MPRAIDRPTWPVMAAAGVTVSRLPPVTDVQAAIPLGSNPSANTRSAGATVTTPCPR